MKKQNGSIGVETKPEVGTDLVPVAGEEMLAVSDMFLRGINGKNRVTAINFKKSYTRALVAMAHQKELVCEFQTEIYQMDLPTASRDGKPSAANVVDANDLETGEDIILVLNAMMLSALKRAGDRLAGRAFAFRAGAIKADKAYRIVDVVEIEVQRAPVT